MTKREIEGTDPPRGDGSTSSSRRGEILAVALDLFSRQGYGGTTTREITDRLSLTPGALYYHFRSKAACLRALIEPYIERVEEVLERYSDTHSRDTVEELLAAYQRVIMSDRTVARLVDKDVSISGDRVLGPRVEDITDRLLALLAGPDPNNTSIVRASASLGAIRRPALRLAHLDADAANECVESALAARYPDS